MEESPQNDNNKNQGRQNDPGLLLVLAVKQGKNNTFSWVFLTAASWRHERKNNFSEIKCNDRILSLINIYKEL